MASGVVSYRECGLGTVSDMDSILPALVEYEAESGACRRFKSQFQGCRAVRAGFCPRCAV